MEEKYIIGESKIKVSEEGVTITSPKIIIKSVV